MRLSFQKPIWFLKPDPDKINNYHQSKIFPVCYASIQKKCCLPVIYAGLRNQSFDSIQPRLHWDLNLPVKLSVFFKV